LISSLVESASKEVSINKIYLMLKSRGIKVSKNTLYDYFSMLQDSFFVFTLKKFDSSMRKRELSIPKIYLGDVGFLNLFSMEEHGRRLENVVFLNLLDKKNDNPLLDIHYWTSPNGKEVDFIVSNGKLVISAIQVCFDISNAETRNKEIKSLLSALNYFKLKEGTIVTKDEERTEYVEEKKINFVPVWKWLLE